MIKRGIYTKVLLISDGPVSTRMERRLMAIK
jgi:hypothetical protein